MMPWLQIDNTLSYRVRAVNVGTLAGVSMVVLDGDLRVISVEGGLPVAIGADGGDADGNAAEFGVDYILSWPAAAVHSD